MKNQELIDKSLTLICELRGTLQELVESEDSLIDNLGLDSLGNSDEITDGLRCDLMELRDSL